MSKKSDTHKEAQNFPLWVIKWLRSQFLSLVNAQEDQTCWILPHRPLKKAKTQSISNRKGSPDLEISGSQQASPLYQEKPEALYSFLQTKY